MFTFAVCLVLAQDRLDAAVRATDLRAVEAALPDVRQARPLVAALVRARERLDVLLGAHAGVQGSVVAGVLHL